MFNAAVSPESHRVKVILLSSLSGSGRVSLVQRRSQRRRELSLLSPYLPDPPLPADFYKQQLSGLCRILAAGARGHAGELLRADQRAPALSSRYVRESLCMWFVCRMRHGTGAEQLELELEMINAATEEREDV